MENDAYDLGLEAAFDASDPPATEQPVFEPLLEAAWWDKMEKRPLTREKSGQAQALFQPGRSASSVRRVEQPVVRHTNTSYWKLLCLN